MTSHARGTLQCFAIAAPGLESIVADELTALGERVTVEEGGVEWRGDARSMMRANLWLRAATRVVVRVAKFRATAFYELEKHGRAIDWARYVGQAESVEFRVTAKKSKLYHTDGIAERLAAALGSRPSESSRPRAPAGDSGTQLFVVRVHRDEFTISADSSGVLLHMRGYRQAVAKAPLRETLAAALLLAAGWNGTTPLVDPFCGSGTIPIEGALIARGLAPGLRRRFRFMNWPGIDLSIWDALLADARASARASSPVPILGSDRDAGAISSARANAERAGVAADVEWSQHAISALTVPAAGDGLIATNPPYGVRVSGRSDVRDLYARFGHVLRARASGWRLALFAPNMRMAGQLATPLDEALRTSNGGIPVVAAVGVIPQTASARPISR